MTTEEQIVTVLKSSKIISVLACLTRLKKLIILDV